MRAWCNRQSCFKSVNQVLGDDIALDLVRSFNDLHHFGVPEIAIDREIIGDAGSAKYLDSICCDFHCGIAAECLGDGGSLRQVLSKGNQAAVERPVEGLVFHYPCYFAPPLSVIRIGDYKLMRHLLTGETHLFNVVKDLGEKKNLATTMPEKVASMDQVLTRYLKTIDAEDVQEVYKARFEELDRFEKMAEEKYKRGVAEAGGDAKVLAALKDELEKDRERFAKNRIEVRENMTASHWAGGVPK